MSLLSAKLFDPTFAHRGPLPLEGGNVVLRNNDVSTFLLDVDTSTDVWARIEQNYGDLKNWHIQLFDSTQQDVPLTSGIIVADRTGHDDYPTYQITGRSHLDYVDGMITLPNPALAADNQTDGSHYTLKDNAINVIYRLVGWHVAQAARQEFMTPLIVSTAFQEGTGSVVSVKTRFKPLLETIQQVAKSGGTTFRTEMTNTGVIQFRQSVPKDRTRTVRLSQANDALGNWSMERARPEVTKVLVAGQGEGALRTLKLVEGNSNGWGTSRLVFQDRRDTDEAEDLVGAGEDTLADGAESAAISIDLQDTPTRRFGEHYHIGDLVTVQISGGATIQDGVQEANLTYSATGREGKLTVGPTGEEVEGDKLVAMVKDLRKRIRNLETL